MLKKNFVSLILGTIGGILFAIGMCMCLLPQWNAFTQGVVIAAIGAVVLLALLIVRRKMEGKPAIEMNRKAIGTILFGIVGTLSLGVGMCLIMVWSMFVPGIIIGIVGIIGVSITYPLYNHITKKQRQKLSPEIIRLTDEMSQSRG